jgi:hypothetical protein
MEALIIYKHNFEDVNVPEDFVIHDELIDQDIGYDDRFHGLELGQSVLAVRIGDVDALEDPIRKSQLDNLNFDWGDKSKYQRYRFSPLIIGLKIFRHLYGFPLPQYDYKVPDESQWPYWMIGMPLGEWTAAVRMQQNMIDEYYPDRKDILNAMEFLWWLPPGKLPDRYYAPLP